MIELSGLPSVDEIRNRIEQIPKKPFRIICRATYLFAARISEIVGSAYPYEKCYGIRGSDAFLDSYRQGSDKFEVAVFRVHTAKRNGAIRNIGLPVDYEPWAMELYEYFQEFGEGHVFPFTRQKVWKEVRGYFSDLSYPIDEYYYIDKQTGKLKKRPAHERRFALHALRHLRATELVEFYGFDGFNLAAYCGWTIRTAQAQFGVNVPKVMARYLYLNWQIYFPKLLKRRE